MRALACRPIINGIREIGSTLVVQANSVSLPPCVSAIPYCGGLDIDRTSLRLDAIGAYPVVAAIMMAAMLDMSTDTPTVIQEVPNDADRSTSVKIRMRNVVTCLFSLINTLSIVASAYSVMVFTLVLIYSKTALGMNLDASFVRFFDATANLRLYAFYSFSFSIMGFIFSLSLSRFLRESGIVKWIESIVPFSVGILVLARLRFLMNLAESLIYSVG